MTKDNKTIVLDFEGYPHYLIPYGNQIVPKEPPLGAAFHIVKTDYVHLQIASGEMEPTIRHDSFAYGQIVPMEDVANLKQGVYAAAMMGMDGDRIAQLVIGRLKEPPTQRITLYSDAESRLPKKVLLLSNIAFLFRLTWSAPRELYLIVPR